MTELEQAECELLQVISDLRKTEIKLINLKRIQRTQVANYQYVQRTYIAALEERLKGLGSK